MNGAVVLTGSKDGGLAAPHIQHGIAVIGKTAAHERAHRFIVFHQQDGLGAARSGEFVFGNDDRLRASFHAGKMNFKAFPPALFTVNPDVAFALLDDAIDRGESQAGAVRTLGGKERLEDVRLSLPVHAAAGVADAEHDVRARFRERVLGEIYFVQFGVGGLDDQPAARWHGVPGVDGKVHEDLFDLPEIGLDATEVGSAGDGHCDVLTDQAMENFLHFGDDRVQVENGGLDDLLPAEGQQLASERAGAVSGLADFLGVAVQDHVGAETLFQERTVADNHADGVVEIVGYASGEAADRFHLLRLEELPLQKLALGDVLVHAFVANRDTILKNHAGVGRDPQRCAVLAVQLHLEVLHFAVTLQQ